MKTKHSRTLIRTGAALLLLGSVSSGIGAQAVSAPPQPAGEAAPMMVIDTPSFLEVVASSNAFEIRSSQMAAQKAKDPAVKAFAAQMVTDHTRAGEALKSLLGEKKTALPDEVAPKHAKMLSQLEAANGADFDVLYVDMQTQAHMEAVALFQTYAGSGEDAVIVGFAKQTLPTLVTHEHHIKMLATKS